MKRIKLHLSACLLLAGSAVFVSSCQDYEPFSEERVQDVAYNREFVRQFGDIDPHQNWDLFGQLANSTRAAGTRAASVNDVEVTNLEDLATVTYVESMDFAKVMPELNVPTWNYSATNLGRVTENFSSTATEFTITPMYYYTSHNDDYIGIYWYTDESDANVEGYKRIDGSDGNVYHIIRKDIYKVKGSVTINDEEVKSLDGVKITYNPTPLQGVDVIKGLLQLLATEMSSKYKYDSNTGYYSVLQEDKTWNTIYSIPYRINVEWGFPHTAIAQDLVTLYPDVYKIAEEAISSAQIDKGNLYTIEATKTYPGVSQGSTSESFFYDNYVDFNDKGTFGRSDYLESVPIHVKIPASITSFGFYLKNGVGEQYSESKLNAKYIFHQGENPKGEIPVSYISTFDMKDVDPVKYTKSTRYLCFEDWFPSGTDNTSDFDLNDCVFKLVLEGGSIVDHDNVTENAILVCEDLAQFDFDFNDVVLDLTYTSGKTRNYKDTDGDGNYDKVTVTDDGTELKVTAMAAGGAYESDICFQMPNPLSETGIETKAWHEVLSLDYVTGEEVSSSEIHYLLGGTSKGDNNDIMNAGATMTYLSGKSITFDGNALERFSLDNLGDYPTHLSKIFANGFIVVTCKHDGTARAITSNGAYAEGVAPQMMLLPDYFEWPQEGIYISDAYNGFNEWVHDITQTDWIFTSQDDQIVTDRGDFSSLFENPGEVVSTTPLTVTNGQTFTYTDKNGVKTHYPNCAKVSFAGITADNAAYAELKVTFDKKPTGETYLDFEGGEQLLEDKVGSVTERTYHLSTTNLRKAITTGAIYFMARGGAEVKISSAVLTIKR